MIKPPDTERQDDVTELLQGELAQGLTLYWNTAADILAQSGVQLAEPQPDYFSPKSNFFSLLFLYSYHTQGIAPDHRVLYAAVNQCLRGMVTGCDNLLDDEYKMTLDTNLPAQGTRFRSILDIMVSDRILFQILLDFCTRNGIPLQAVTRSVIASLHALVRSGAQEAGEEAGIAARRLSPRRVLSEIHHAKTGLLFLSPWAVPAVIEDNRERMDASVTHALYQIGIGCQIMDDMVDLPADVRNRRHNYVASVIEHGPDPLARRLLHGGGIAAAADFYAEFPDLFRAVRGEALQYLENGLSALYLERHRFMMPASVSFISTRIGIDRITPASAAG